MGGRLEARNSGPQGGLRAAAAERRATLAGLAHQSCAQRRRPHRFAALGAAALGAAALALAGCGPEGGGEADAPVSRAASQAVLALPAPYNRADLANGRLHVALCRSCHTLVRGGPNMTGPNLWDVVGRAAAAHPGFEYSQALRGKGRSGLVWSPARLDAWLASPSRFAPGTKMAFAGLKDPSDRRDVIAYLKANGAVDTPP